MHWKKADGQKKTVITQLTGSSVHPTTLGAILSAQKKRGEFASWTNLLAPNLVLLPESTMAALLTLAAAASAAFTAPIVGARSAAGRGSAVSMQLNKKVRTADLLF